MQTSKAANILFITLMIIIGVVSSDPSLYLPDDYTMIQNDYVKNKIFQTQVAANHNKGLFSHKVVTPQGFHESYFYVQSVDTFYAFTEYSNGKWTCTRRKNAGMHNLAMDPLRSAIISGMQYTGIVNNCLNIMTQKIGTCDRYDNKVVTNMVIDYYINTNHTGAFQLPLQMYKIIGDGQPTLITTFNIMGQSSASDFSFPVPESTCQNQ